MRYWCPILLATAGLLALAACGKASDPAPAAQGGKAMSTPASASTAPVAPVAGATAMLDRFVSPRQKGTYAPRDECGGLPGARVFREKLAAAVQARDAAAIAALASEDIRLGFAGDDGRARFLALLKADNGKLIDELAAVMPLGCAGSDGGGLTIPWFFAQEYGDLDSYSAMLVTGEDVPLRASAEPGAASKQSVSWDMVTLDKGLLPDTANQQVTTVGGAKGFLPTGKLRSMLDYRLLAVRQGETWRITAFLAGD